MDGNTFSVDVDVPYVSKVSHIKQHLDVYTPNGSTAPNAHKPVVIFVHGGGWRRGDKSTNPFWGAGRVGKALSKAGYIAVLPSYRLSQASILSTLLLASVYTLVLTILVSIILSLLSLFVEFSIGRTAIYFAAVVYVVLGSWFLYMEMTGGNARHPEHAQDIAATIKWTIENISKYGGDNTQIFLAGHSAGAHLVTLLTLDRSFVNEQGVTDAQFDRSIRGVIGISGVYNVKRLSEFKLIGLPLARWVFVNPAFHPHQYEPASPVNHRRKVPQEFLLLIAERDHLPLKVDFRELCDLFTTLGVNYESQMILKKNHRGIMFDIDSKRDRTTDVILEWLHRRAPVS